MHTDYTQYINICNNDQAPPYDACSICLGNKASYHDLLDNAMLIKFPILKYLFTLSHFDPSQYQFLYWHAKHIKCSY